MTDDERVRMEGVPWPLVRAAAWDPRVQAALHRHVFGGRPLPEVLRSAHRDVTVHAAEMGDLARVPTPAAPPWPEGPADKVTQRQVDALLGAMRLHHDAVRAAADRIASARPPAFRVVLPADAAGRLDAILGSAEFTAALRDAIIEAADGAPAPRVIRTGQLR